MKKAVGIYLIKIDRGSKPPAFYVGQSVDMAERRMSHLRALRAGRHDNTYMLNAFRKYGEEAFAFYELLHCSSDNLIIYEQIILDWYRSVYGPRVVNVLADCVRSHQGVKRRPDTIIKMSLAQKGRKKSPEQIEKMSVARLGARHTEETKRKLSEYHIGRPLHPNSIAALEAARETTRLDRLRETLCGKPKIHSEETKQKIATALRGRPADPAANEKRRQAMLGRKMSPEAVAKRVASRLANAEKRKADPSWSPSKVD